MEEFQASRNRLLAILAADVVEFSRLIADDSRATVEALDATRDVFRRHVELESGRIVDMAGDSVLAVFETATAAVRAACAAQAELNSTQADLPENRRLIHRVGLHVGDVIEKGDGTVYGDGVNVAARLEGLAGPGSVVISRAVHDSIPRSLAKSFVDFGSHGVKNIEGAVHAYRLAIPRQTSGRWSSLWLGSSRIRRYAWVAGTSALLVAAAGGYLMLRAPPTALGDSTFAQPTAGPLSIAVLPFVNLTGDPAQSYVADGMTASITSDLSRIRDVVVVGAGSSQALKNKPASAREAGSILGVRFVLQGNVQRDGNKLRVNAQLSDAQSDAQLWSETFNGDTTNLFALQDQVTTLIGNSMGRELVVRAARASERASGGATVADLMLRQRALEFQPQSYGNWQAIEALCREVLKRDPGNIEASAYLAQSLSLQSSNFAHETGPELAQRKGAEAVELASRVVAADPDNGLAHRVLGVEAVTRNEFDVALLELNRSLALLPKDPISYNNLAVLRIQLAQPDQAIELVQRALALKPKHPSETLFALSGHSELMRGNYDAAIGWFLKGNSANPASATFPSASFRLIAAYQLKGDHAAAKATLANLLRANPDVSVSWLLKMEDVDACFPAYRDYVRTSLIPALRAAGLPD